MFIVQLASFCVKIVDKERWWQEMKQLLIHMDQLHTQAAVVKEGVLTDFFVEQTKERSLVGNIYKGIVKNVLPGMQAAFIDIGLSKNAFIYVDDLLDPNMEKQPEHKPAITQLVTPGQQLIVQVVKDSLGNKGARVTTHYNLAGRWLVYMPNADYIGVSKKLLDEAERERLRRIAESMMKAPEGIIMRTAAIGETEEALKSDIEHLREQWQHILDRAKAHAGPCLLHSEEQLLKRVFRDLYSNEVDAVWVSSKELEAEVTMILKLMSPSHMPDIRCYMQTEHSIISHFSVNKQLREAFERRIPLASGGYIIWDTTEALTVIDVNTGKYVGVNDLEETLFQTNKEAAELIARLLRIRDTGGMIIIDFIDMEQEENRSKIYKLLNQAVKDDAAKCAVFGWTKLGLMEMTRKKTRDSYTAKYLQEIELK